MRSIGTSFVLLTATSMLAFCGCKSENPTRVRPTIASTVWAQGFPETHPEETKLNDVQIGDALQSFLSFAKASYSFAPGLTAVCLSDGRPVLQHNVTVHWVDVTAAQALQALMVTYGLALQKDAAPDRWLVREASAAEATKLSPVSLADKNGRANHGNDTGPTDMNLPGVMLKDVINSFANQSHLNVILAPSLFEISEPGKPPVAETPVTRKGNVSSVQSALQALFNDYHLEAVEIPGNPILIIRPKQP